MNNMRIGGLASGMDIDQIISDLMKVERKKVDTVEQNKQILQWRQENYQEVNRVMANFILDSKKEFSLNQTSAAGAIRNSSVSSLEWVKSASLTDSQIADVKAYANAVQGTYNINVTRLAANWSAASSEKISVGDQGNLATQLGLAHTDTLDFTITTNQGSVQIKKTNLDSVSMTDLVNEINKSELGVTAVYDSSLDRFFLQTKNTGNVNTISISDHSTLADGGSFITGSSGKLKLQYLDGNGAAQDVADSTTYAGEDAVLDFGAAKGITQSSNTFTINNVNIMLKATGTASLNVTADVKGAYEKISAFVQKYNEMIDKLNLELSEERYVDYKPLTDEQRETLTGQQIEQWEEKAKSGLLRNDTILERAMSSIRSGLYQEVTGVAGIYKQLTEIGISTESYASGSRGDKLVINTDKLTKALEKDVDSVLELLFKKPEISLAIKSENEMTYAEVKEKRSQSGLITRLYDNVIAGMKKVIQRAGPGNDVALYRNVNSTILIDFVVEHGSISILERDIDGLNDKLKTMSKYMLRKEDHYWRRFTEMEKAIQRMNQQSLWLAQQFGGYNNG